MSANRMLFPPAYETFDAARHRVERREIALAFDRDGVREVTLADVKTRHPDAEYPCAMRALLAGEHDIGWGEKLLVAPEDVAMCVVNGNALIRDAFVPLLFDHGFTGKGTESPGDVLEFFEQGGDLWALVDLSDEEMYQKACKPGKRWKSRSLGFGAWVDAEQRLRAAQPKELSLTNLPRLKGLGRTVEMSHVRQLFTPGFGPGPAGLVIPASPAAPSSAAPEGQLSAAAGGGASLPTPTSSPDSASKRKEERMFNVPPKLQKLLGRAEFASEDDFNKAVEALDGDVALGEKTTPPAAEPPAQPAPAVSLADVDRIIGEKTQAALAALVDANAKAQADAALAAQKKARVDAVLDKGFRLGRILKADFDLLRPSVEANPDAFEARLASMPKVAPVQEDGLESGGEPTTLGDDGGYRSKSEQLTYAAQFARAHNMNLSEAEARIAELRAN